MPFELLAPNNCFETPESVGVGPVPSGKVHHS